MNLVIDLYLTAIVHIKHIFTIQLCTVYTRVNSSLLILKFPLIKKFHCQNVLRPWGNGTENTIFIAFLYLLKSHLSIHTVNKLIVRQ